MTKKDILFKFYEPEELVNDDISYFGWEKEGGISYAFYHIAEAYKEAAKLIYEKMSKGDIANKDMLIYPLCFNHHHCMELYLKTLYIKYSRVDEEELKKFFNTNHNLLKIWEYLKPILEENVNKVGSSVKIDDIENYIKEMHEFDESSMRMRYLISKKLEFNNKKHMWLDFYNFHECMLDFYKLIETIDFDIDNQVSYQAKKEEYDDFLRKYEKAKQSLINFINILEQYEEDKTKNKSNDAFSIQNILDKLTDDEGVIIETLYFSGRNVNIGIVRLPLSPKDKVEDFVNFCISIYCDKSRERQEYLQVSLKKERDIIKNIKTSMDILDGKNNIKEE